MSETPKRQRCCRSTASRRRRRNRSERSSLWPARDSGSGRSHPRQSAATHRCRLATDLFEGVKQEADSFALPEATYVKERTTAKRQQRSSARTLGLTAGFMESTHINGLGKHVKWTPAARHTAARTRLHLARALEGSCEESTDVWSPPAMDDAQPTSQTSSWRARRRGTQKLSGEAPTLRIPARCTAIREHLVCRVESAETHA